MDHAVNKEKHTTFSDLMRERFKGILDPLGAFFNRIGLMPNTMTIFGLAGNVIGAVCLSQGWMTYGGLIILASGLFDALDGTMARLRGEPSDFGAFVDSVTDRYSELVIFGSLLYYYLTQYNWLMAIAVYIAACGSVLVSYIRARGQAISLDTKVGILTRFERYLVLAPSLILNIPPAGILTIALLANYTAVQRIRDIRRQSRAKKN